MTLVNIREGRSTGLLARFGDGNRPTKGVDDPDEQPMADHSRWHRAVVGMPKARPRGTAFVVPFTSLSFSQFAQLIWPALMRAIGCWFILGTFGDSVSCRAPLLGTGERGDVALARGEVAFVFNMEGNPQPALAPLAPSPSPHLKAMLTQHRQLWLDFQLPSLSL